MLAEELLMDTTGCCALQQNPPWLVNSTEVQGLLGCLGDGVATGNPQVADNPCFTAINGTTS